MEVHEKSPKIT